MNLPDCHLCKKPVDKIEREDDLFNNDVKFTAYCHGEKEEVVISADLLIDSFSLKIQMGTAFRGKKFKGT